MFIHQSKSKSPQKHIHVQEELAKQHLWANSAEKTELFKFKHENVTTIKNIGMEWNGIMKIPTKSGNQG